MPRTSSIHRFVRRDRDKRLAKPGLSSVSRQGTALQCAQPLELARAIAAAYEGYLAAFDAWMSLTGISKHAAIWLFPMHF